MSREWDLQDAGYPLSGKRIVVTRAAEQAGEMVRGLEALGATPVLLPAIAIVPVKSPELDAALDRIDTYDWIVFTSSNAVQFVLRRMAELALVAPDALTATAQVAAVGEATSRALQDAGVPVALVPDEATGERLLAEMIEAGISSQRILFPASRIARRTIPDGLRNAGANVNVVVVYDTRAPEAADPDALMMVRQGAVDTVTLASPSAVRNFRDLLGEPLPDGITVACIGPTTSATARECGFDVAIEPADHTVAGLIEAIVADVSAARVR